jgi:hypothetical protein
MIKVKLKIKERDRFQFPKEVICVCSNESSEPMLTSSYFFGHFGHVPLGEKLVLSVIWFPHFCLCGSSSNQRTRFVGGASCNYFGLPCFSVSDG